ncbi:MAG: matrixin family metalloprotease [Planctomycetes bacterium]|nr:matrixin family metalloprotease [Planctomycetota bacterium]
MEVCEQRRLLTGLAPTASWSNAAALTVSFAPDGTSVVGQSSQLFSSLNNVGSTQDWQQTILDAFQTWASNANINFGLIADSGADFGTAGQSQGDSRFGDIRIAAIPMGSDVLAISVPANSAVTGRWTGEILFNSNATFSNLNQVFGVALHEVGHVLGLMDSTDPLSPLNGNLTADASHLPTSADLAVLQQVYGQRGANPAENTVIAEARELKFPAGVYTGATPLVTYGSLDATGVSNFFEVERLAGYKGSVTLQLRTSGLSQLGARISVYDGNGNLLGQSEASGGQNASVTIAAGTAWSELYAQIDAPSGGINSVGTYALVATFDANNTVSDDVIDQAARGQFTYASPTQMQQFFVSGTVPVRSGDSGAPRLIRDGALTYFALNTTPGFARGTDYTAVEQLSAGNTFDTYRVTAPAFGVGQPNLMTVNVSATQQGGLLPQAVVTDSTGKVVPSQIVANGQGTYAIQVSGVVSGRQYFVRVTSSDPAGAFATGGYALHVQFGAPALTPVAIGSGVISTANPVQYLQLDVGETELTQFNLSSGFSAGISGGVVQLSIYDANNNLVYELLETAGGLSTGAPVLLNQGRYTIAVTAVDASGATPAELKFDVSGLEITEPIGPLPINPTLTPPVATNPVIPNSQPLIGTVVVIKPKSFVIPVLPSPSTLPGLLWIQSYQRR